MTKVSNEGYTTIESVNGYDGFAKYPLVGCPSRARDLSDWPNVEIFASFRLLTASGELALEPTALIQRSATSPNLMPPARRPSTTALTTSLTVTPSEELALFSSRPPILTRALV